MSEKALLSWEDMEKLVLELGSKIEINEDTTLIAVSRGGSVPAAILGQQLKIKRNYTICLESYSEDDQQDSIKQLTVLDIADSPNNIFVDDLVDTGKTLAYLKDMYPQSKFAAIYKKPHSIDVLDYYVAETDKWIIFPWEIWEKQKHLGK